jgi:hypothetical protein
MTARPKPGVLLTRVADAEVPGVSILPLVSHRIRQTCLNSVWHWNPLLNRRAWLRLPPITPVPAVADQLVNDESQSRVWATQLDTSSVREPSA